MENEINEKEIASYESSKEKGKKYIEKFKKAFVAVGTRPDELQEALAFYEGDQYKLANYSDATPWVIQSKTPHAKIAIDTRTSSVTASEYVGELQPLKINDVQLIKMLNELLLDEWERLELDNLIDNAVHDGAYLRESYLHLIFDSRETLGESRSGTIDAYLIDSPSVYIDPNARTWNQAQFIVVAGRKQRDEARAIYPITRNIKTKTGGLTAQERGEIGISNDYEIEQSDFFNMLTFYEKKYDKSKLYIMKTVVIEDVVVKQDKLDGLTMFPICQFRWGKKKQSCYGMSLMDDLISNQKAINSIESAVTNQAINSASPAVVVSKNSGLNPNEVAETIGMPQMVYYVNGDPTQAMHVFNPNSISEVSLRIKEDHQQNLSLVAGITDAFIGTLGTAGNTSGGAQAAIDRAKVIEAHVIRNITEFVEQITKVLMQYIVTQYAGQKVSSLKKNTQTNEFTAKEYDLPADLKDVKYKFYVNLNIRTPYAKHQERTAISELWAMERQYDSEIKLLSVLDILDKYDLTNREELQDRYKRMMNSTLQQKTEVILKLTELTTKYQLPQELLQQAMIEIMGDAKETPAVDQLTQLIEQASIQAEQMAQQQAQQAQQANVEAAQMAATQVVDQMDPNMVMQMAQEQSAPNQIAAMINQ